MQPPTPNLAPISSQRDLMYVPLEQLTVIQTLGSSIFSTEISKICTLLALRSTSFPALARSQSFFPSTFKAEYIGGIWS